MLTAVLDISHINDDSWDFLPQDLWVAILDRFVSMNCSSIGFSGIEGTADVSKIECFSDWRPLYLGRGYVSMSWQNAYSKQIETEREFALFEYSNELHDRIREVDNTDWAVYDERYPADELYFFQRDRLLVSAVPYEGSILFCELNDQQKESLIQVDERIAPNLHRMDDMKILSEVKTK